MKKNGGMYVNRGCILFEIKPPPPTQTTRDADGAETRKASYTIGNSILAPRQTSSTCAKHGVLNWCPAQAAGSRIARP